MSLIYEDFLSIIHCAINSVTPKEIFKTRIKRENNFLIINENLFNLDEYEKIYVIGFGKASSAMASEFEKYFSDRIEEGFVITKYNHKTPTQKIEIFEAGHPIPDKNTLTHSNKIIELLHKTKENDLVICLISGGGSSLFENLIEGFTIEALTAINEYLIHHKFSIHEINKIRKALSKVKGGKLLSYVYPSELISIIISDVVGDDLSTIASGPTYLEEGHNFSWMKKNQMSSINFRNENLYEKLSKLILFEPVPEKIVDYYKTHVHNFIVASNKDAVNEAAKVAKNLGYNIHSQRSDVSGTTEDLCSQLFSALIQLNDSSRPIKECIIWGGETYLEVQGSGLGGRNTHFVLQFLHLLTESKISLSMEFLISSIATDGNDGRTDSAGAFITGEMIKKIFDSKIDYKKYLMDFDSYNFFNQFNGLIKTGPTLTNVMDVMIALVVKN